MEESAKNRAAIVIEAWMQTGCIPKGTGNKLQNARAFVRENQDPQEH